MNIVLCRRVKFLSKNRKRKRKRKYVTFYSAKVIISSQRDLFPKLFTSYIIINESEEDIFYDVRFTLSFVLFVFKCATRERSSSVQYNRTGCFPINVSNFGRCFYTSNVTQKKSPFDSILIFEYFRLNDLFFSQLRSYLLNCWASNKFIFTDLSSLNGHLKKIILRLQPNFFWTQGITEI